MMLKSREILICLHEEALLYHGETRLIALKEGSTAQSSGTTSHSAPISLQSWRLCGSVFRSCA